MATIPIRIDNIEERMNVGDCELYAQGVLSENRDHVQLMLSLQIGAAPPELLGMLEVSTANYPVLDALLNLGSKRLGLPFHYELHSGDEQWRNSNG